MILPYLIPANMNKHRIMFMFVSSCPSNSTSQYKTFDSLFQRIGNILFCWFRVVFLMFGRNKRFVIIDFSYNWKFLVFSLFSIIRCTKNSMRTYIIGRSWEIDYKIFGKKVIVLKRNKNVCKRSCSITNISDPLELAKNISDTFVDCRWITIFSGVYTCIVCFIIDNK